MLDLNRMTAITRSLQEGKLAAERAMALDLTRPSEDFTMQERGELLACRNTIFCGSGVKTEIFGNFAGEVPTMVFAAEGYSVSFSTEMSEMRDAIVRLAKDVDRIVSENGW